jgi:hypothetical protein
MQKSLPNCTGHLVAINYVRGKKVQRCFCGAAEQQRWRDATLLALRQYDKRRAELNER